MLHMIQRKRNIRQMIYFLLMLTTAWHAALGYDPYSPGSHVTDRIDVKHLTTIGLSQSINVWTPIEGGSYPVVFFLDAFGAEFPGKVYDYTMTRIASHGFVVINAWRLFGSFSYSMKLELFNETIYWCKDNLEIRLHSNGITTNLTLNYDLSFGMGHSAGSHVLVDYLKTECGDFKGLILSSPVDGLPPQNAITPGVVLNFALPTLVLPAGLDNVPGGMSTFGCAPDPLSNLRFWDALDPSSPRWLVNATEYGHGDYLDQKYVDFIITSTFCPVKDNWTLEDFVTYRDFFSGQVVAFLKGIIEDDPETYLPFIEDLETTPVITTGQYVDISNGNPSPYCNWTQEYNSQTEETKDVKL